MQIYHYHPATGVLLYASDADQSPLEENVYLIPAHATDVAPPVPQTDQVAAFINGEWVLLADWTAKPLWLLDGTQYQIGQAVPAGQFYGYGNLPAWLASVEPPPAIAQAKAAQLVAIDQAYAATVTADISFTTAAGVTDTFQADAGSQQVLAVSMQGYDMAGAVPDGFFWKAANNDKVPFTLADLKGLYQAMLARGWTAFQKRTTLKAEIAAATTVAAAQAITW